MIAQPHCTEGAIATNRDSSDENDEISLLNLAEDLLEKLAEIGEELAE
jgi:hypothetical protein